MRRDRISSQNDKYIDSEENKPVDEPFLYLLKQCAAYIQIYTLNYTYV